MKITRVLSTFILLTIFSATGLPCYAQVLPQKSFSAVFGQTLTTSTPQKESLQNKGVIDHNDYYILPDGREKRFMRKTNHFLLIYSDQTQAEATFGAPRDTGMSVLSTSGNTKRIVINQGEDPEAVVSSIRLNDRNVAFVSPILTLTDGSDEIAVLPNLIVKMSPKQNHDSVLQQLQTQFDLALVRQLKDTDNEYELKINSSTTDIGTIFQLVRNLSALPEIDWAEPNFIVEPQKKLIPNDPMLTNQWHLNNTGQLGGAIDADIDAPQAWDNATGSNTIIAIFDDGVDTGHEDLQIWSNPGETGSGKESNGIDDDGNGYIDDYQGWNFGSANNNPNPETSTDNHGTACAGVAGARGNNGLGVSGSAMEATILPVRSSSMTCTDFGNAMRYAGKYADVVSNSWSIGACESALDSAISDVVHGNIAGSRRGALGAPVLFAAGNNAGGWTKFTLSGFPAGTYNFEWKYVKNETVAAGYDTVWLDEISWPGGELSAFEGDSTGVLPVGFTGSGSADWTVVNDGVHARGATGNSVKAGSIIDSQESSLLISKTVGAGNLVFWVWVSSEQNYDFFELSVDGTRYFQYSAGQYGHFNEVGYPANNPDTIAVGASNDGGSSGLEERSYYSQFGADLDFVTPSGGWGTAAITTTDRTGTEGYNPADSASGGNYTTDFSGTSSATPLAAGIAATLLSQYPSLTAAQVRTMMRDGCDQIGPYVYTDSRNDFYGHGRLNLNKVLGGEPEISCPECVHSSTDVPKAITDNTTITSTIEILATDLISDVNLTIDLAHTWDADLILTLIAPDSTRIILSANNGGDGDGYANTIFDDEAATSITSGTAPFPGSHSPQEPLNILDGLPVTGIWTLEIADTVLGDQGTLLGWSLEVTVIVDAGNGPPVLDPVGSKSVDELDLLSFTATAFDPDLPANNLTFSLSGNVPAGAAISTGGDFTWTPTEEQGPGPYTFDVVVTDDGTPNLSDSESITVTVNDVIIDLCPGFDDSIDTDGDGVPDGCDACPITKPIRIEGKTYYWQGLQWVYDNDLESFDTVKVQSCYINGPLELDLAKDTTIQGGHNCDFTDNSYGPVVIESLIIVSGRVTVDNVVVTESYTCSLPPPGSTP